MRTKNVADVVRPNVGFGIGIVIGTGIFTLTGVAAKNNAVVFFARSGFEAVANLGEKTSDPGKDMPRGLLGTLAICTVLYVLVCFVLVDIVAMGRIEFALCVGLMTNLTVETWLRFLVWLVLGLVVHGLYGRKHANLATQTSTMKP